MIVNRKMRKRGVCRRKHVTFTVILLNGLRKPRTFRAAPNTFFSDRNVEDKIDDMDAITSAYYPKSLFRLVPLADGNFNVIEIDLAAEVGKRLGQIVDKELVNGSASEEPTGLLA